MTPGSNCGVYRNLTFEQYQQIQAVNCSRLVAYAKTPAHALVRKPETAAMRLGRAIHCALMEPDVYEQRWATMPEGMIRRGKDWEAWKTKHEGAEILNATEEESIKGIAARLASGYCETAKNLISLCTETELALVWQNPKFGCLCKARLDGYAPTLKAIVDLKSTSNADPDAWIRTAINYGGLPHWQAGFYLQGAQAVLDPECKTFLWIVVETSEPYGISVVQAAPAPEGQNDMAFMAKLQMDQTLERYLESERLNRWPGYPDQVVQGALPSWYVKTAL